MALQDPQNCSVPAGSAGNPGFSLPIVTSTGYNCGPSPDTGLGAPMYGACKAYLANLQARTGLHGNDQLCDCSVSGCFTAVEGAPPGTCTSHQSPISGNTSGTQICTAGYTLVGGNCVSAIKLDQDASAAHFNVALTRNADGLITDFTTTSTGEHWQVTAFDSSNRPTVITNPDASTTTVSWYPNSAQIYEATSGTSTVRFLYNEDGTVSHLQTTEGNVLRYEYSPPSLTAPQQIIGIHFQTAVKDCYGARSGTPVSCNTVVGPDPDRYVFVESHPGSHQLVANVANAAIGATVVLMATEDGRKAVGGAMTAIVDACKRALDILTQPPLDSRKAVCDAIKRLDEQECYADAEGSPFWSTSPFTKQYQSDAFVIGPDGKPLEKWPGARAQFTEAVERLSLCMDSANKRWNQCMANQPQDPLYTIRNKP
jgi:hypothetical protein